MNKLLNSIAPGPEEKLPAQPAINKEPPTPVDYVRIWVGQFGDFTKGNIEKSRLMQRDQLTKEDAEFLVSHGVTQLQIANQYQIPLGSLTFVFKKLGMNAPPAKIDKEEFVRRMQAQKEKVQSATEPLPGENNTASAEQKEVKEIWFTESLSAIGRDPRPLVTVRGNHIALSAVFMRMFGEAAYVHFCAASDGRIKIRKSASGIKLCSPQKAVRCYSHCRPFLRQLSDWGVQFPAVYIMTLAEDGVWVGDPV